MLWTVATRYFVYLLCMYAIGEILILETRLLGPVDVYSEWGIVERLHSGMLALAVLILAIKAWRDPDYRAVAVCMALALSALLLRENDATFELFLPHGVWKYPAAVLVIVGAWYAFTRRQALMPQVREYAGSRAFGMFATAIIVLAFSRFFGQTKHWTLLMGDAYMRQVKNAAEEGVELLALTLVAMAMLEFALLRRHGA